MADSDLLLKDQSATPAGFAPESTDQGTNPAGTTIKRSMFGSKDGAQVTIGAKADAAWDGSAASASLISIMKAGVARLLGIGGSTVPVSGTVALSGGNATAVKVDGSAVTQPVSVQGPVTIAPQRVESLWTDDTGAFAVRVDLGGTITWTDLSGNTVSAPGTGARPAAGASVLLSRSSFQATAPGSGYSSGDYLDHFVTTDPASGVVLGNFWVNLSTGAKLAAAPAFGNISPAAPLPLGAATAAAQAGIAALLAPSTGSTVIAPGTPVTAGRRVFIACTAAGSVRLKLSSGSTLDVPVSVGPNLLDNIAIIDVVAASTTATAVVSVLN